MRYRQLIMDVAISDDVESEILVEAFKGALESIGCKLLTPTTMVDTADVSDYYEDSQSVEVTLTGKMVEIPIQDLKAPMIIEYCSHCEGEVQLENVYKVQDCPHCKKKIMPCSICKTLQCSVCLLGNQLKYDSMMDELVSELGLDISDVLEDIRMVYNLTSEDSKTMINICRVLGIEFNDKEEMVDWLTNRGIEGFGC